ncbi:unnamed protein product [Rhizoctonia solani]|uniref:Rhodanese domain-containing protein n=1 Tax=Rhizoctonia solani TaxID=456999 RepID=A0A8H3BY14_9AGAM|nr:unnamed protein product [Rhizoctonia solani]
MGGNFSPSCSTVNVHSHPSSPELATMNVFSGKTALLDFYNPDKNPPLPLVELPSHPFEDELATMNVFSGKTALLDFYNPDKNPPLPLVELPSHPFEDDNVRIYAKMLTLLPAGNVKSLPALNMLMRASEAGQVDNSTERIVEYSSGNTVISLGIISKIMGGPQVGAYISNKTSTQKMELLRFFGLDLTLFGGPAQVEPADVNGGIYAAIQDKWSYCLTPCPSTLFGGPAQVEPADVNGGIYAAIQDGMRPGWYNPGQYSSPQNSEAHVRWTGPQIHAQLPKINVFAAAVGTSGTMTGTGSYLKTVRPDIVNLGLMLKRLYCPWRSGPRSPANRSRPNCRLALARNSVQLGTMTGTGSYLKTVRPDIVNLGVFTAPGDRVPGPRPIDLVQTVDLPWQEVIDAAEHVSSKDSYRISLDLCRQGLLVGPSSGLSLQGLYQYLEKAKKNGELDTLRADDGSVYCAFICCDQPYQYISDYFTKLEPSCFPPIYNTELLDKDLYPYGVDWIISPNDAFRLLYPAHGLQTPPAELTELDGEFKSIREPSPIHAHAIILDLRSQADFTCAHIHGSKNLDIRCAGTANPFKNPQVLAELWETLRQALIPRTKEMSNKSVLLVSYNEEIAYVGCSVLRKEGIKAFALGGGFEKWKEAGLDAESPTARH